MDIYIELIRKRIKEKFKTIENFSKYIKIPRTTINFILKRGIASSNYTMVNNIFKTLDITHINDIPVVCDDKLLKIIEKYNSLDDLGKHAVHSIIETEYRRVSLESNPSVIAAFDSINSSVPLTEQEKLILTLTQKIKDSANNV